MMPVLELDSNKNVTVSYLCSADGVVYRRKSVAAAHWGLDEGNGTIAHDSDGQNNGALGDGDKAPAWSLEGGGSLLFDGTNDRVKVPDSDALDINGHELAISCWVKRSSATSGNIVKKMDDRNGYRLWITAVGKLKFEIRRNGAKNELTTEPVIPVNEWTHIVARYDESRATMRVFINGVKNGAGVDIRRPIRGRRAVIGATTEPLWLGYFDGVNHNFHGYLKDVSIYSSWLNGVKIRELATGKDERYQYHHTNALGSNIVLTDGKKNVIARYEYDAFGAVRAETGTSDNPRKFTGKEYESDVKLYYYGARYYDPYAGRFISRDPVGDGLNWYIYGANNPLKYIDPTGTKIVVLDAKGNPEITLQKGNKNDYHGGSVFTLSNEAGAIYRAIAGTGDKEGTSHPALKNSNIVGQLVQDVIDSDKTVYVTLDPKLGKPGEADFVSGDSDDEIMIRLGGGKNASSAKYGPFLDTRLALVHELVHAHQAINDPATFRNRDYHNVFDLEYEAYDKTAQFAQDLGGHYNKALKYVPEWYLHRKRFNPGSAQYKVFINRKAKESAQPFR